MCSSSVSFARNSPVLGRDDLYDEYVAVCVCVYICVVPDEYVGHPGYKRTDRERAVRVRRTRASSKNRERRDAYTRIYSPRASLVARRCVCAKFSIRVCTSHKIRLAGIYSYDDDPRKQTLSI